MAVADEVVFNTGMVGYPEALMDPSYRGQILMLTAPIVGSYGVPGAATDEHGLSLYVESDTVQVTGLMVQGYSPVYSHWSAVQSLGAWLRTAGVPALQGVDARALTTRLRAHGSLLGRIEFPALGLTVPDTGNV